MQGITDLITVTRSPIPATHIYMFEDVDGDLAIVSIPAENTKDGKEIRKKLPLEGLFDPSVAKDQVVLAKSFF